MTNIEQLKKEVDDFKTLLDELKNNVTISEAEKKNKAEALKNQAETTKKKIEAEISALADKTDNESKRQKEEAEALLRSLDDIVKLQMSIMTPTAKPTETPTTTPSQTPTASPSTTTSGDNTKEGKGFRGKTKDFLGEQWDAVKSGEKRKEEPGKNLLRVAGVGLTGYAIYKGVKGLWNRAFGDKKEDEESDEDSDDSEKKSKKKKKKGFWKTTAGKILKWTGIGVGVGTLGYWIGKKLHLWGEDEKKPTDTSPDKIKFSAYEEFYKDPKNKESVENYEQLGENIDITYEALYDRELKAGYQDDLEMKRIAEDQSKGVEHYKGIIPFCLDNKFGSIENILSQNSSMKEAMTGGLRSMISYVKNLGTDFMKTFAESFLSKLPSWTLVSNLSGSLSEKVDQWIAKNQNAEKELQYFFRQSIRVQTYLFEKREQLEEKIAEDNARKYGKTKEELLKDKDNYEKYIEKDERMQKFLISPISTGVGILKENNIFDSKVGDDVKESVKNLDKERDKVLGNSSGGKDILQVIYEKKEKGEAISDAEKQLLGKSCDGIIKDIDENIMDAVDESAWNIYGDLFRTDDADLRKYLDKSGLEKVFQEYKTMIAEKKGELLSGRLDAEGIAALADTINNMLALKKEAILGAQTIEKDYDENGNIIYRIPGFLAGSIGNLVKGAEKLFHGELWAGTQYLLSAGLGTGIMITAGGVVYGLKTGKRGIAKKGVYIATFPASCVYSVVKNTKWGRNKMDKVIYGSPKRIQSMTLYKGEEGPKNLMSHFREGHISLERAEQIASKKIKGLFPRYRDEWCSELGIRINDIKNTDIKEMIFCKMLEDIGMTRSEINKIRSNPDLLKKLIENYDLSPELRTAIGTKSLDNIKKAINKIDTQGGVDVVVKPAQELLDNPHYKNLQNEIDTEIKDLEFSKNGQSEAKIKQIEAKIQKLKDFKKNLEKISVQEVESLEGIYKSFLKVKKGEGFFDNMDIIVKLFKEESDIINEAFNSLKPHDLLTEFMRLKRQGKFADIADNAILPIVDILKEIKTKNIFKVGEKAVVPAIKSLLKLAGAFS